MHRITTTIKREFLAAIVAGRKKIEYRELKPYWTKKLEGVKAPFELHLVNGMSTNAPRVLVEVCRVRKDSRRNQYELHLGKILEVKHWNRRTERPSA
jgi:hypothetical protein